MEKNTKEMFVEQCEYILPRLNFKTYLTENLNKILLLCSFSIDSLNTCEKGYLKSPRQVHLSPWDSTQQPTKACNQKVRKVMLMFI